MSVKDKTTEKRGGQVESEGDDDNDEDVGDGEGDGVRREKLRINNLRVLHKTRTHSTHALIFGALRWIAVATGNIHMKTSQEQ